MIYGLAREGVTIFVTTHYLDEAEYANRIGMIHNGMLRALASPAELKRSLPGQLLQMFCDAPFRCGGGAGKNARHLQRGAARQRRSCPDRPAARSADEVHRRLHDAGLAVRDVRPDRADAGRCLHQPHHRGQ